MESSLEILGNPRWVHQQIEYLVKAYSQIQEAPPTVSSLLEWAKKLTSASLLRALIPLMRAPPSWSDHTPEVSPQNIITVGIRISAFKFEADRTVGKGRRRDTNFYSITVFKHGSFLIFLSSDIFLIDHRQSGVWLYIFHC